MKIKNQKFAFLWLVCIFCFGSFFTGNNFALASEAGHIVISEIQISGEGVNDEFVELYNPTDSEINLENWDLKRKTKSGSENNILNNIEGAIPSGGYFLIVPRANCGENKNEDCYKGSVESDDEYTTNSFLAEDNTLLLYNGDGSLIDKIGWGEAGDFEDEVIKNNPEANQSLKRKIIGGKIQDTDNNKNDFEVQDSPNPQNSNSIIETGDGDDDGDEPTPSPSPREDGAQQEGNNNDDNDDNDDFDIIITELVPNPEDSDAENEFIEIYNQGTAKADLGGWTMEDKLGKTSVFTFPENTILF